MSRGSKCSLEKSRDYRKTNRVRDRITVSSPLDVQRVLKVLTSICLQGHGRNRRFLPSSLSETRPSRNTLPSHLSLPLNSFPFPLNCPPSHQTNRPSIESLLLQLRSQSNQRSVTTSMGTTILHSLLTNTSHLHLDRLQLLEEVNGNLLHLLHLLHLPHLPTFLLFPYNRDNNKGISSKEEDLNLPNPRNSNTKRIKLVPFRYRSHPRITRKGGQYLGVSKKRVSCSRGI